MDVRAAVAIAAGKPLEITTVQLDGPRDGEVLVEIKATGICHTDEFTLPFSAMKVRASCAKSVAASPR
jgi:S-(hydroxymethyl)glutathione dehydrogenase / alcohol dehydrogenase